jgi:hypothetical protein
MRKTSAYARKQRRAADGGTYNGAEWLNTIQRARSYTDEPIPGSFLECGGSTLRAANNSLLKVHESLDSMLRGGIPTGDTRHLDMLDHAVGVAWLRMLEIAGEDPAKNPALPPLKAAHDALHRVNARHAKTGVWAFDGQGAWSVREAIGIYEEVLLASSPAQMADAASKREQILLEKMKEKR